MENKHAPLPAGWKLRRGYLVDPDGYERWVEDGRGRLDNTRIAAILENHNLDARRWYLTSAEFAGPELLEACRAALSQIEDFFNETVPVDIDGARPRMAIEKKLRAAIAAAEGRDRPCIGSTLEGRATANGLRRRRLTRRSGSWLIGTD